MLTEIEAPDQPALEEFFPSHSVHCEGIRRIDLDAKGAAVTEY